MAGPPKDVPASELFRKLLERPRPSEVVDFPRYENGEPIDRIRLQVLTMREQQQARKLAWDAVQNEYGFKREDMRVSVVEEGAYGNAVAREVLAMACRGVKNHETDDTKPPKYTRWFATGAQVDQVLTADEMASLFTSYVMVQKKYGPYARDIETEAELNAWIKRLMEGGSETPLALRDSQQLIEFSTSLVVRTYVLSLILDSLREQLPPSLVSELTTWGIGTGYYSEQPESGTGPSSSTGNGPVGFGDLLAPTDEPLSIVDAANVAQQLVKMV